MSVEVIKYAFVAGEVSPTLFGRTDLEKYDLGLAKCQNFFVDYKGGISTRPGTIFLDYVMKDQHAIKMFPFQFDTDIADTYMMFFGNKYVRFMQNGAYVEEPPKMIDSMTRQSPARVQVTAHGFETGDWVRMYQMINFTHLNQRIAEIQVENDNRFWIFNEYGEPISTTGTVDLDTSGGLPRVQRIFTLKTPYLSTDLPKLRAHQIRDLVRLTHPAFKTRNLIRFAADDWVLVTEHLRPKGQLTLRRHGNNLPVEEQELTLEQWLQYLDRFGWR